MTTRLASETVSFSLSIPKSPAAFVQYIEYVVVWSAILLLSSPLASPLVSNCGPPDTTEQESPADVQLISMSSQFDPAQIVLLSLISTASPPVPILESEQRIILPSDLRPQMGRSCGVSGSVEMNSCA